MRRHFVFLYASCIFCAFISPKIQADGWDPLTQATNMRSIVNTRHNLTVSFSNISVLMDIARNNYEEVCVYCHTPHGANSQIAAPLWNRTISTTEFTIYDKARTLDRPISQPGPNSLTCLSCHDGVTAIDSVINMPGSGLYNQAQESSVNMAFLDTWTGKGPKGLHFSLGPEVTSGKCTFCHNPNGITATTPDYTVFAIGQDLRDDHPIGILYPDTFGAGRDFAEPDIIIPGQMSYFDLNGNNFPNTNEVRLYDSGDGPEVECASCHDPHGVPSNGTGSKFNPSFLRVNNGVVDDGTPGTSGIASAGPSALCLTCHTK